MKCDEALIAMMKKHKVKQMELAGVLNMKSRQEVSRALSRGGMMRLGQFVELMNAIGCEVAIVDKDDVTILEPGAATRAKGAGLRETGSASAPEHFSEADESEAEESAAANETGLDPAKESGTGTKRALSWFGETN